MASFTIALRSLRFYAGHGLYPDEQAVGNSFEVNLELMVKAPKETVTSIAETINYAAVYELVKDLFQTPTPLLETLAMQIAAAVKTSFPQLKKISVEIIKQHPPITAFTGSVSVTYRQRFDD